MATALFISRTDLVKNTIIDGNVDTDKFIQFIKIAQEIHITNYLGSKLYDKISFDWHFSTEFCFTLLILRHYGPDPWDEEFCKMRLPYQGCSGYDPCGC